MVVVSLRKCDRCAGPMDIFERPPCCLHEWPCALSFCWPCGRIWYRGPCAKEAIREDPPEHHLVLNLQGQESNLPHLA